MEHLEAEPFQDHLVGTLLADQYRLLSVLKRGRMGVIYRARQENVNREVAVKILRPSLARIEERVLRFEAEAAILGQLRHPNTVRLYDCGRTVDGCLFLVTELLHGESLRERLDRGPLPIRRVLDIAEQICGSLAEAHEQGFIHRDLNGDNIFLDRVGIDDHVKVLDFGIAEQLVGTPLEARSDIRALGLLLREMLSAIPGASLSPELEALVDEMLSSDPKDRPKTMREVRERLRGIMQAMNDPLDPTRVRMAALLRDPWARWGMILGSVGIALFVGLRLMVAPVVHRPVVSTPIKTAHHPRGAMEVTKAD